MSTQAATLPTKAAAEEAYNFLTLEIDSPAFFAKLAEEGIVPRNEAEAQQLWELGHQVEQRVAAGHLKLANAPIHPNAPGENAFLASALDAVAGAQPAAVKEANADAFIQDQVRQLVRSNDVAKQAALICAHVELGGELADNPAETEPPQE